MLDFDIALMKHLNKCELEFRAKHLPRGSTADWLAPHCESVQEIASFLRYLGFRIAEIVDDKDTDGELMQWVITTSGIVVYVNSKDIKGLVGGPFEF